MKRMTFAVVGILALAGLGLAAQQGPSASAPAAPAKAQTFIGCLKPGSASGRFSLIESKEKGVKKSEPVTLDVVADSPKVNIDAHMGQEVEISGSVDAAGASETKPATLKATSIKWRSDYCG
jgi:hypothetical protein